MELKPVLVLACGVAAGGALGALLAPWAAGVGAAAACLASLRLLNCKADGSPIVEALDSLGTGEFSLPKNVPFRPALEGAAERVARTQADFRARLTLLEQVIDAAPQAIVVCDAEGAVVLANRTASDLFHRGRPLTGRRFKAVLAECPPDMAAAVESQADQLFTLDQPDGEPEAYLVSRPFFEVNTRRYTLYMVKHLTRELSRQEVAIWKKMIRVISHELNNSLAPASSLLHSARLIAGKPEHAQRLVRVFDALQERVEHLATFIEGYARFARLAPPEPGPVAWPRFMDEARAFYPFALRGELPGDAGWFDASQVQQALINLLKNAAEAGSEQTEVAVEIADGGVCVSVLDRGQGMSEKVRTQALLPFYSTKKSGTGLGLALVREIAEAHSGHVRIEARGGGGTAVHLWLPDGPVPGEAAA